MLGSGPCPQYVNITSNGATGVSSLCQVLPAACTVYAQSTSTSSSRSTTCGNFTRTSETKCPSYDAALGELHLGSSRTVRRHLDKTSAVAREYACSNMQR